MLPRKIPVCALSMVLVCGLAASTFAQSNPNEPRQNRNQTSAKDGALHYEFFKGSDLIGKDVNNPENKEIATVEDFILDRGSGRIEYALLHTGGFLGLGGKTVAVRYDQLGYSPSEESFTLGMTAAQLKQSIEFIPENWSTLERSSWADDMDERLNTQGASRRAAEDREHDLNKYPNAEKKRVQGTIQSIQRTSTGSGSEQVVAVVKTSDGKTVNLHLGPAWYVMGNQASPVRGQTVDAETRVIPGRDGDRYVATSATINGRQLKLRNDDSSPSWRRSGTDNQRGTDTRPSTENRPGTDNRSANTDSDYVGRLMLMSDLIGARANALDAEGGEVQNAIVERRSGRIGFIAFDPNDNFLGMGDEILLVPWQAVSVRTDKSVYIDADKNMFSSSARMPDDLNTFAAPARLEAVYSGYGVEAQRFEPISRSERSGTTR